MEPHAIISFLNVGPSFLDAGGWGAVRFSGVYGRG